MYRDFEGIRLRRASEEDIEYIYSTEHSEENIKYVIAGTADWHRKALQNSDMIHFIAEAEDGKNIGLVILAGLEDPDDCLELMRLIVDEKGKGYGRKLLKEIKRFAFEECKAHRLWLDVKDYNERAINLYKSEGFSIEGHHRECVKTGNIYESLYIMGILIQEYRDRR